MRLKHFALCVNWPGQRQGGGIEKEVRYVEFSETVERGRLAQGGHATGPVAYSAWGESTPARAAGDLCLEPIADGPYSLAGGIRPSLQPDRAVLGGQRGRHGLRRRHERYCRAHRARAVTVRD